MNGSNPLKVTIVDYGMGNLRSVWKMAVQSGADVRISSDPADIEWAEKLILPGVGAFPDAMSSLDSKKLTAPLSKAVIEKQKPILGICLGMQLMCKRSNEVRPTDGLGWIDAEIVPFNANAGIRVPHVGWNTVTNTKKSRIMDDVDDGSFFYFVHSFHMVCVHKSQVVSTSEYGNTFTASIETENIFGTQFHPEKSQSKGSGVMANFLLDNRS